jgi:hypothetical protein
MYGRVKCSIDARFRVGGLGFRFKFMAGLSAVSTLGLESGV